ncbi:ABC transporter substrate-binding protein [Marinobacterium lutimaris]|uniref:Iron complex transport system substrate-binding protein n=1 Tax=Marinobacterium lutimaris TaxID=568106 RepID=A0A1H5WIT9_9GAMM|nr:ABC transporter substrate-binding protein [Marinobacterium lutimaris]SEF99220.1 iron complex transport system substrate-binding protein [Marinobacterium lutimaris]
MFSSITLPDLKRLGLGLLAGLAWLCPGHSQAQTVTDLAGRQVEVPAEVQRIILGESRYIPALAILEPEQPLARIVGMLPDLRLADPGSYAQYQKLYPEIDQIPEIGRTSKDSFSLEQTLTLDADLALFGLEGHGPSSHDARLINQLEQAGVTVLFLDFRQDPIRNTPVSMQLLGEVLGRTSEAAAFTGFYRQQLNEVDRRLAQLSPELTPPTVFLHSRVGRQDQCCETMVRGMLGHFIDYLGATNIAADSVPGVSGVLNLEYLLVNQPDVYIATAIGSPDTLVDDPQYIALGAGIDADTARSSFQHVLSQPGLAQLNAVETGRAFAVWHHFYNSPFNIAALQAFAQWLYPETFADLKPEQTLATLYQRFQPVGLEGAYWTGVK